MSREFEVTREVDLPAAPDDVWTAITADTAAWQFPTGLEIPAGSAPPEGSPVTTWDPPHRLVVRMESPDGTSTPSTTRSRPAKAHGAPALRPAVGRHRGASGRRGAGRDGCAARRPGLYRFFGRNHYGSVVGMSAHLFVDGVDAAAREAELKAWLDGVYA